MAVYLSLYLSQLGRSLSYNRKNLEQVHLLLTGVCDYSDYGLLGIRKHSYNLADCLLFFLDCKYLHQDIAA